MPVYGGLFMIVMGCVHGEMAREAGERGELLPYDIYKDIHDAIRVVLSLQQRRRGILIDFDWVGVHGTVRYPASLALSTLPSL